MLEKRGLISLRFMGLFSLFPKRFVVSFFYFLFFKCLVNLRVKQRVTARSKIQKKLILVHFVFSKPQYPYSKQASQLKRHMDMIWKPFPHSWYNNAWNIYIRGINGTKHWILINIEISYQYVCDMYYTDTKYHILICDEYWLSEKKFFLVYIIARESGLLSNIPWAFI